ncbi:MAG TPA: 6-phosphogluconolactonase [Gillisia sp.]|nr:6-phosphogluconolactonase [Gillisia sp.]
MTVHISKTIPELIKAIAAHFISVGNNAIATRGEFNVVLSGGNSPKKLYELLASPGYKEKINWKKINFFFGDERVVPANDPENNAYMVKRTLFDPLNISQSNIFPINTSLSPQEAAKSYTATITEHLDSQELQFDLILLGLGDNAHTASLFPYTPVLTEKSASVQAVFLEGQKIYRISMTAPLINRARNIAFLVYGQEKAEAVHLVLEGEFDPEKYPAQLTNPLKGELHWFLDEAAASLLERRF